MATSNRINLGCLYECKLTYRQALRIALGCLEAIPQFKDDYPDTISLSHFTYKVEKKKITYLRPKLDKDPKENEVTISKEGFEEKFKHRILAILMRTEGFLEDINRENYSSMADSKFSEQWQLVNRLQGAQELEVIKETIATIYEELLEADKASLLRAVNLAIAELQTVAPENMDENTPSLKRRKITKIQETLLSLVSIKDRIEAPGGFSANDYAEVYREVDSLLKDPNLAKHVRGATKFFNSITRPLSWSIGKIFNKRLLRDHGFFPPKSIQQAYKAQQAIKQCPAHQY